MSGGFGSPQGPHDHSNEQSGEELRPGALLVTPNYNSLNEAKNEKGAVITVGGTVYHGNGSQFTALGGSSGIPIHNHSGPNQGGSSLGTAANNVSIEYLHALSGDIANTKQLTNIEGSAITISGAGDLRVQQSGIVPSLVDTSKTFSWSTRQDFGGGIRSIGNITDRNGSVVYDGSSGNVQNSHLQYDTLGVTAGSALSGGGTGSLGSSVQINVAQNGISNRELDLGITPTWTGQQKFSAGIETGTLAISQDSGSVGLVDMPVTSASTSGSTQAYQFNLDGSTVAEIYSESNGAGGVQSSHMRVPTSVGYLSASTPTPPSSGWKVYTDSADSSLKAINSSGSIATLAA